MLKNIVIKLPYASNSSIELSKFAVKGLKRIFKEGYHYKKAGVVVLDLVKEDKKQMRLFENSNPKHKPLMDSMDSMDKINHQLGQQKIKLGSRI